MSRTRKAHSNRIEELERECAYLKKSNDHLLRTFDKVLKLSRRSHLSLVDSPNESAYAIALQIWLIARRMKLKYW